MRAREGKRVRERAQRRVETKKGKKKKCGASRNMQVGVKAGEQGGQQG